MRQIGGSVAALMLLIAAGCGRGVEAAAAKPAPKKDPYVGWPADTIAKPSEAGAVEQTVLREASDAEGMRLASRFMLPDWTQQTEPLMYKSPKGAKLEIHYLQRGEELRKADDAKIEKLIAGDKTLQSFLVIARPWRGWYGEANTASGKGRVRVYSLFQPDRYLELHVEWLKDSPKSREDALEMVAQVVHSIRDLDQVDQG